MTRDEAITLIKPLMLMMKNPQGKVISDAYYAFDMAIKALEQEPSDVLSKIRAEISEYKDDKIIHAERNEMIDIVLDIIDKYRAERSDKE